MSSSVAVSNSNPAPQTAAANTFAGVTAATIAGGSASGLFFNLLGMKPLSLPQSNTGTDNTASTQFGKSGLTAESTLLVLPQGIANLSESDLQALLANAPQNADGTLTNKILVSLTPGTPAAEAIAKFLSQFSKDAALSTNTELTADTTLSTTNQAATSQGQILLVATNLSPADMAQLKKALSEQGNTVVDLSTVDAGGNTLDGTDATDATTVALVMFVPPPVQLAIQPAKNLDASLNLAVSVDAAASITSLSPNLAKYVSPFDPAHSEDNPLGLKYGLSSLGDTDFKGSMSANNAGKSADGSPKDVSGKIDNNAVLSSANLFQEWTASLDTAPISTNSGSLLGGSNGTMSAMQSTLTNPIINNAAATGTHPATQMVAAMLEKSAAKSDKNQQTLTIQLDPVELGRVQVQLSYEKGETMKVHILAETKDTFSLLQRDSHALKAALEQAGIQTDNSSLSFDMAGSDQSFNQMLGQFQDGRSSGQDRTAFSLDTAAALSDDTLSPTTDTTLNFIPDTATGTVRYSLLV